MTEGTLIMFIDYACKKHNINWEESNNKEGVDDIRLTFSSCCISYFFDLIKDYPEEVIFSYKNKFIEVDIRDILNFYGIDFYKIKEYCI